MGVFLVLGWIVLGMVTMTWFIQRPRDASPYWIPFGVLVYFGVPMLTVALFGG